MDTGKKVSSGAQEFEDKSDVKVFMKNYFSSIFVYGIVLLIYSNYFYYLDNLAERVTSLLFAIYLMYIVIYPFYYFFIIKNRSYNKNYYLLMFFLHLLPNMFRAVSMENIKGERKSLFFSNNYEKLAFLSFLVKYFYIPLMVNFLFGNIGDFDSKLQNFSFGMDFTSWYFTIFSLYYLVDVVVFAFSYIFESPVLNNEIKSVEPTLSGWVWALMCYPPFNALIGGYVLWYADSSNFTAHGIDMIFMAAVILLTTIYVGATLSLGFRSGNLVNRGVVRRGTYSVVRHPAYASKVLSWWVMTLPVINMYVAFTMLFWTVVYFMRAVTEERHLLNDPDYVEYCKKVKYRFIPYIY